MSIEDETFRDRFKIAIPRIFRNQICRRLNDPRLNDLLFELKNEKRVAFEPLSSEISVRDIKRRTLEYTEKEIYVFWILNGGDHV